MKTAAKNMELLEKMHDCLAKALEFSNALDGDFSELHFSLLAAMERHFEERVKIQDITDPYLSSFSYPE